MFDPYEEFEVDEDELILSSCVACSVGDHDNCKDSPDDSDKFCCCEE